MQRNVLELRNAGRLPWDFIADSTRWQRKPETWDSAEDALRVTARTYRRNLWREQSLRIEVWLEKDALAGVLVETTDDWDVALMITRGVSSSTFLHPAVMQANRAFDAAGIATVILLLFDYDAGGARAAAKVRRHFRDHGRAPVEFVDVAVREEQRRSGCRRGRRSRATRKRKRGARSRSSSTRYRRTSCAGL